jgi:hypothetical protein
MVGVDYPPDDLGNYDIYSENVRGEYTVFELIDDWACPMFNYNNELMGDYPVLLYYMCMKGNLLIEDYLIRLNNKLPPMIFKVK